MQDRYFISHFNLKLLSRYAAVAISIFLLSSCNIVKRVKDGEHLIVNNTILEDGNKTNNERINNIIIQKTNSGVKGFLGIKLPIKLGIYNLARPNIDSILYANILSDTSKVKRRVALLSKKQFDKSIESRRNFNAWLKRTGEAPTILDESKTKKTANNLKKYYYTRGWLDNEVNYEIVKDSNKRAEVIYKVTRNKPYILDSLKPIISSPAIDSLYEKFGKTTLLQKGVQFDEQLYENERDRINTYLRNSGFYYFGQDYVRFIIDTIGTKQKVNTELIISDRTIRGDDSTTVTPFKIYKIKEVNIFTDDNFTNRDQVIADTTIYKNFNLYSKDRLRFRPKALTDAVFINKGDIYSDLARSRTQRYLNDLQMFRYPSIDYIENAQDTSLIANIYLEPKKKYALSFDPEINTSNIQTIGFSFSTGLKIRNVFRGAETLEITGIAAIGASKNRNDPEAAFFDINEFGGNVRLTIPRLFSPFNTDRIIPKYMSPSTTMNLSATSQQNIGLDKQAISGVFSYNWYPSKTVTNTVELFNVNFVKNLNTNNYFGVYKNSFDRLNIIARDIGYIANDETLYDDSSNTFTPADIFISDVLSGNTGLSPNNEDYVLVNNIDERKQRLTENNLIFSSSFDYKKDRRKNIFDNDFSVFKWHVELAGNLLSNLSSAMGSQKNDAGNYEIFGVAFSQYFKTELDYVKYIDLGRKNVLAFRSYAGIAIPFGNSNSIPFAESFFAGGPNDNRAWTAYDLGPGSSKTTNEFNEANFKIHLSAEQRFSLFGAFQGAIFVDAGNIWNVLDNVTEEAETFTGFKSLKDIAVGSGIGLRYDFSFFVLRFDVGFKTYDPSLPDGERWFKDYNFRNAVYNIGINYPF
ncbi:surface antigen-like protein [Winogradskyella epiphytica]|uniref:Surface antigen-like protein n=1 Tax=Winogradskyella epiphytica TaxID=262005 RepID=A0A2V4XGR5_9FLAO|nr:BamA/TamA family outer membrane protein [Winogradskyella epiphytica]PYE82681.1 surface antigen-like protein [Winogradskyella epiphytica]GGW72657.1 membrane protein [Winogradskyella epiphytica]